jgi:hypothetical protein
MLCAHAVNAAPRFLLGIAALMEMHGDATGVRRCHVPHAHHQR